MMKTPSEGHRVRHRPAGRSRPRRAADGGSGCRRGRIVTVAASTGEHGPNRRVRTQIIPRALSATTRCGASSESIRPSFVSGTAWIARKVAPSARSARAAGGYQVVSTDIADRGFGNPGVDFLACRTVPEGCRSIVTNLPYGDSGLHAGQSRSPTAMLNFLRHALMLMAGASRNPDPFSPFDADSAC
jgi:hypothetical protein